MPRNTCLIIALAAALCTGCPPSFPPSELEGAWRASNGDVLQMRSILAWIISTDPISYPQNNPPCSGYSYVWCKATMQLNPDATPKQIDINYPILFDPEDGFVYCASDPNMIGYNFELTAGQLTQSQAEQLETDYELAMMATLQLSGKTVHGIYRIVDDNHIEVALADPGDPRPTSFANAVIYTRDSREYSHHTLASFCPGS